jgi:hypothetical protein
VRVTIVVAGVVAGIFAAISQILFHVFPPYAYGICVACHARDLVNWLVNFGTGSTLLVAGVSVAAPVLTVIGLVLGAYAASKRNKEFRFKTTKNPITSFVYGFLVMTFALTLGGCTLRTVLRIAYGDVIAVIAFASIALGVIAGAQIIKWSARRALKRDESL